MKFLLNSFQLTQHRHVTAPAFYVSKLSVSLLKIKIRLVLNSLLMLFCRSLYGEIFFKFIFGLYLFSFYYLFYLFFDFRSSWKFQPGMMDRGWGKELHTMGIPSSGKFIFVQFIYFPLARNRNSVVNLVYFFK